MVAFTDTDRAEIQSVMENGGSYTMRVSKADIAVDDFEESEVVKSHLYTGFSLDPSWTLYDPGHITDVLRGGDAWTRLVAKTYYFGGRIVYRKIADDEFEATIEMIGDAPRS